MQRAISGRSVAHPLVLLLALTTACGSLAAPPSDPMAPAETPPDRVEVAIEAAPALDLAPPATLESAVGPAPAALTVEEATGSPSLQGAATAMSDVAGSFGFLKRLRRLSLDEEVAVDPWGAAYFAGLTNSNSFPKTIGDCALLPGGAMEYDGFVTKLDPLGQLVHSRCLGGTNHEEIFSVAVDSLGRPVVTGETGSLDFPTTDGSTWQGSQDTFVTSLAADSGGLVHSGYLGGNATTPPPRSSWLRTTGSTLSVKRTPPTCRGSTGPTTNSW